MCLEPEVATWFLWAPCPFPFLILFNCLLLCSSFFSSPSFLFLAVSISFSLLLKADFTFSFISAPSTGGVTDFSFVIAACVAVVADFISTFFSRADAFVIASFSNNSSKNSLEGETEHAVM